MPSLGGLGRATASGDDVIISINYKLLFEGI